jgi:hypothetical protein
MSRNYYKRRMTSIAVVALLSQASAWGMSLMAHPDSASPSCALAAEQAKAQKLALLAQAPEAASKRLTGSEVVRGSQDIAWAWLASPTLRYPHASMGSREHAGSLHVVTRQGQALRLDLPLQRVFEDLQPRLHDLDGDGRDEILVIEAEITRGAALVAYGVHENAQGSKSLREVSRTAYVGSPWRWLNPIGVADFDGDGKLDIASVTTPHIGGVLKLYHVRGVQMQPFASVMDTSNHRMGDPNLQLHAIVQAPGQRPTIIVPDMTHRALHALRWEGKQAGQGAWKELADVKPLPSRITTLMRDPAQPTAACAQLDSGVWWRIELTQ